MTTGKATFINAGIREELDEIKGIISRPPEVTNSDLQLLEDSLKEWALKEMTDKVEKRVRAFKSEELPLVTKTIRASFDSALKKLEEALKDLKGKHYKETSDLRKDIELMKRNSKFLKEKCEKTENRLEDLKDIVDDLED